MEVDLEQTKVTQTYYSFQIFTVATRIKAQQTTAFAVPGYEDLKGISCRS